MKQIKINIDDLAEPMIVVTNRLYSLAEEQKNKGNMALYFVLDDLYTTINDIILNIKYPTKKEKE